MKKMTNLAVVHCIIVVGVTMAQSPKPILPSSVSMTQLPLIFNRRQFTQNALDEQLDSMLWIENNRASGFFHKIIYTLTGAMDAVFDIRRIINKASSDFNAALRPDAKNYEKSREIFQKWYKIGDDLESKYWNCTKVQYAAAIRYDEKVREAKETFDALRGYKTELKKCNEGLFSRVASVWCIQRIGYKLQKALPDIRAMIFLYKESLRNLTILMEEVKQGNECLNTKTGVPAELLDFRIRALTIVKNAIDGIDL